MSRSVLLRTLLIVFALGGLVLSYLTLDVHARSAVDPAYRSPLCHVSERLNCAKVLSSEWSAFLGVPLGSYGIAFYGTLLGVMLLGMRRQSQSQASAADAVLTLSLMAVLVSLGLFAVSKFIIQSFCPLCLGTYVCNIGLLISAYFVARERFLLTRLWSGIVAIVGWPLQVVAAGSADNQRQTGFVCATLAAFFLLVAGAVSLPYFLEAWAERSLVQSAIDDWYAQPVQQIPLGASGAAKDHARGDAAAPVVIVEFADYECPTCRRMHPIIEALMHEFAGKILFIPRHFPIDRACNKLIPFEAHKNACHAAMFARCAGEQGKFWEANEMLFTLPAFDDGLPAQLVRQSIDEGVALLKLDAEAMGECMHADRQVRKIEDDISVAEGLGLTGTPTLWINGRKLLAPSEEILRALIAKLIREPR